MFPKQLLMKVSRSTLLVLVLVANSLQGLVATISLDGQLEVKRRLEQINKPTIKSFQTNYGDILDCVDINKQLVFDHPLLKNHFIQMKPSINISKWTRSSNRYSSALTLSQLLPKNMRCPKGTVPIKRILEEDLAREKFSPLLGIKSSASNSSKFVDPTGDQPPQGDHVATVELFTKNFGIYGSINVWNPQVQAAQFSSAAVFVASDDGSVSNAIVAGWSVNQYLYPSDSRLYTYWTKDSGKSTGCFNIVCSGFVQTSQEIPLGFILRPTSTYGSDQYLMEVSIEQDTSTKNWWLVVDQKAIGYWPKELFSTLTDGATRGGWGGEVLSPVSAPTPAMGSGHLPDEGFRKAAFIKDLEFRDTSFNPTFPSDNQLKKVLTNPKCYNVIYHKDGGRDWGHYFFFGGPANCKL